MAGHDGRCGHFWGQHRNVHNVRKVPHQVTTQCRQKVSKKVSILFQLGSKVCRAALREPKQSALRGCAAFFINTLLAGRIAYHVKKGLLLLPLPSTKENSLLCPHDTREKPARHTWRLNNSSARLPHTVRKVVACEPHNRPTSWGCVCVMVCAHTN